LDESDLRIQIDCSEPSLEVPFPKKLCGSGFSINTSNLAILAQELARERNLVPWMVALLTRS
jgi:hypothetical protein